MRIAKDLRSDSNDLRRLKQRSSFLFLLSGLLILVGVLKIIQLTVLETRDYFTESENNRIISEPIYPARGLIKLMDGQIVAENIVTQELLIKKGLVSKSIDELKNVEKYLIDQGTSLDLPLIENYKDFEKITILSDLTDLQLAKFQVNKELWPSVELNTRLRRFLPHKNLFSHVVGHLGELTKEDVAYNSEIKYHPGSYLGKVGLERRYESQMRGIRGIKKVEVDVFGNQIRELERLNPVRPLNLSLSIDLDLQMTARKELGGRKGAVIAIDPNTGFIKALVSSPDYNPNVLNKSESGLSFSLNKKIEAPFFNRVISGSYPPASTIKPFLGLLGLENSVIDQNTEIDDKGIFQINEEGRKYRGWKEEGHGKVNLHKAIVESSDVIFMN